MPSDHVQDYNGTKDYNRKLISSREEGDRGSWSMDLEGVEDLVESKDLFG